MDPHGGAAASNLSLGDGGAFALWSTSHTNTMWPTVKFQCRIQEANGPYEDLVTTVKKWKLRWYSHLGRSTNLAKPVLQGTVPGGSRGRQQKQWHDNMKGVNRHAFCWNTSSTQRQNWMASCSKVNIGASTTIIVKRLLMMRL